MCRESGYGFWLILIKFRRDKDMRERERGTAWICRGKMKTTTYLVDE